MSNTFDSILNSPEFHFQQGYLDGLLRRKKLLQTDYYLKGYTLGTYYKQRQENAERTLQNKIKELEYG